MDTQTLPLYKALREVAGLTQRAVERRLEWKTGRLSVIERGLIPTPGERQALLLFYTGWLAKQLREEEPA